ncbi:MAG: dTDP-4-dehydrorhamnose 3,5-epimerase [Caulobacter sp.]|nr:dTDP-4-dehydrorhamnose 3,5-epimerase [Caulobacter sp.]
MEVERLDIPEILLLRPQRFADDRGYFVESFNARRFADATGVEIAFLQDNQSLSHAVGTVRGLHFQRPPSAQAKLVGVSHGRILDVAVDARRGSPTFGRHVAAELSAENGLQIFVPEGFLHGFMTLEPDTLVSYKVNAFYNAAADGCVRWDDPDLAIDWPSPGPARLSPKDAAAPAFAGSDFGFEYVSGEFA